jgi:hypothetical protein
VDSIWFTPNLGPVVLANVVVDLNRKAATLSSFAAVESISVGAL